MFYLGETRRDTFPFFWCSLSHGGDSNRVTFLDFLCPITYFSQGINNDLKLLVSCNEKLGSLLTSPSLSPWTHGVCRIYIFVLFLYVHIPSMEDWPQSQDYPWLSLSKSLALY